MFQVISPRTVSPPFKDGPFSGSIGIHAGARVKETGQIAIVTYKKTSVKLVLRIVTRIEIINTKPKKKKSKITKQNLHNQFCQFHYEKYKRRVV